MTLWGADGSEHVRQQLSPDTELAGRYRVVRCAGAGGMGTVYEVVDEHLDERVALKLLHQDLSARESYRQRLRAEVRLARRVSHPNVCRIHDLGRHDDQLFVTMELVDGETLRHHMREIAAGRRPPLPLPRIVDILVQVCSALAAAHRAGVLHRDVKPDNVMLQDDRVVLTDFGVAGLAADTAHRRVVAGTPAYIAPEVLLGQPVDHRLDVYSCAVTAYEFLTGRQPFPARDLDTAIARARKAPPMPALPPRCGPPPVREALTRALSRALDADPRTRTASLDAFAEALSEAARNSDVLIPLITVSPQDPTLPSGDSLEATVPEIGPTMPPVSARTDSTILRAQIRVATAVRYRAGRHGRSAEETTSDGEALERIIVDLGGTPLEVRSTEVLALFGAPVALGDDAVRATRAARALVELGGGCAGIDTARVLWRSAEDGHPGASGDAIARADNLAREADAGQVLVSPATARHLVGRFRTRTLPSSIAGLDRALAIQGPVGDDEPGQGAAPLIGRRAELGRLEELVREVCEQRSPRFASVTGPAGFGKSRLRQALVERISERREIDWLICRATPLGASAPLSILQSADPAWLLAAEAASDHAGSLTAARRWLERRAARRPVVVVVEDAQWMDEASRELIAELHGGLDALPVAVIWFQRPEAPAPCPSDLALEIEGLEREPALELARHVAPAADDAELAELVARSGGNPFFVSELARDLRERGDRVSRMTPLPETVEAVVQARLDRLPPLTRELACAAAVVGREFWRDAARAALSRPGALRDAELDAALADLERRAIARALPPVAVDDDRYIFESALVRDVAYQQLEPRERRRAHGAVGRWLERHTEGLASRDPAVLAAIAQHRDAAGDEAGARAAWRSTGERSLALHAYREATEALRRTVALTPAPDAELLEKLGDAAEAADSYEAAERAYRDALERSDGELLQSARLWRKLGRCASSLANATEARACYERGLELVAPGGTLVAEAERDPREAAALFGGLGWLLGYQLDDNATGLPLSQRAAALLQGTSYRRELAESLSRLGGNYQRAGLWDDQLRCNERNLEIGVELDDPFMQLTANVNLGQAYYNRGDFESALDHTGQALTLGMRIGSVTVLALVHSNLAGIHLELGDLDLAERHLNEGIRRAEKVGNIRFLPESFCFSARLALRRGQTDEARIAAERALEVSRKSQLTLDEAIAARVLAGILARMDRCSEARQLIATSREGLRGVDAFEEARTAAAEARILERCGAPEAAGPLRQSAADTFRRLGAARDLAGLEDPDDLR